MYFVRDRERSHEITFLRVVSVTLKQDDAEMLYEVQMGVCSVQRAGLKATSTVSFGVEQQRRQGGEQEIYE